MSGMFTQAKKASHNTRQDAVRFAEADIDCDGKLDYAVVGNGIGAQWPARAG